MAAPNRMNFTEKCLGGEVPFNPKTDVADYGNFKEGFCSMKLIQKSDIRVQDMFFFNNCIEKNQNKTNIEEGSSSHTIFWLFRSNKG